MDEEETDDKDDSALPDEDKEMNEDAKIAAEYGLDDYDDGIGLIYKTNQLTT